MDTDIADSSAEGTYVLERADNTTVNTSRRYSGKGLARYPNGDEYDGEFVCGKRNGSGTYKYANGNVFEGTFADNAKQGIGKLQYGTSGSFYHGYYEGGLRTGEGTMKYDSGDVYCGGWKDGNKHGYGIYVFAATKYKIIGEWEEGNLVRGSWQWVNGTKYVGNFVSNKPDGEGSWVLANGNTVYGSYSQRIVPIDGVLSDNCTIPEALILDWKTSAIEAADQVWCAKVPNPS